MFIPLHLYVHAVYIIFYLCSRLHCTHAVLYAWCTHVYITVHYMYSNVYILCTVMYTLYVQWCIHYMYSNVYSTMHMMYTLLCVCCTHTYTSSCNKYYIVQVNTYRSWRSTKVIYIQSSSLVTISLRQVVGISRSFYGILIKQRSCSV